MVIYHSRFEFLLGEQSPINPYDLIRNIARLDPAKKETLVSNSRISTKSKSQAHAYLQQGNESTYIQTTVSATSSGVPSTPIGISAS